MKIIRTDDHLKLLEAGQGVTLGAMKLSTRCLKNFDASSRARGHDYFKAGQVRLSTLSSARATFAVQGATLYSVGIGWGSLASDKITTSCTCPYFLQGTLCKHIWAAILLWETLPVEHSSDSNFSIHISRADADHETRVGAAGDADEIRENDDDLDRSSAGETRSRGVRNVRPVAARNVPIFKDRTLSLDRRTVEISPPFSVWERVLERQTFFQLQRSLAQNLVLAITVTRDLRVDLDFSPFAFELAIRDEGESKILHLYAQLNSADLTITCPCDFAEQGVCLHLVNGLVMLQLGLTQAKLEYGYADWRLRNRVSTLRRRVAEATAARKLNPDLQLQRFLLDPDRRRIPSDKSYGTLSNQFSIGAKIPGVPDTFVTPARFENETSRQDSEDLLVKFFSQIRIQFSDGIELSLYELLFHPYIEALPEKMRNQVTLCLRMTSVLEVNAGSLEAFADLFGLAHSELERRRQLAALTSLYFFFENFLGLQNEFTIITELVLESQAPIPLSRVSFAASPVPALELRVHESTLVMSLVQATIEGQLIRPRFAYDPTTRVLRWDRRQDHLKKLGGRISGFADVTWSDSSHRGDIAGPEDITQTLAFLEREILRGTLHVIWRNVTRVVREEDCSLELKVDSRGAFTPVLRIVSAPRDESRLIFFSPGLRRVIQGLHGGLAEFFESRATELALKGQGDRRKNDLKVLKHRGAFLSIYVQTLLRVMTEAAENEELQEFVDRLHQEILDLVFEDVDSDPALCSRKIKILIKQTVEILLTDIFVESVWFAHAGQLFHLQDYGKILNRALSLLARIALAKKSPVNIFRARGSIFESQMLANFLQHPLTLQESSPTHPDARLNFDRFETADWFEALPHLKNSGVVLFINDQPIYELAPDDLRSEFSIDGQAASISKGRVDWFALHPKVFFRGKEIAWGKVRHERSYTVLEHEGRSYLVSQHQLPTLIHLHSFWEQLIESQRGRKRSPTAGPGDRVQLKRHQILDLLVLRLRGVNVQGGPGWDEIWRAFENLGTSRDALAIRPELLEVLKPYQHEGIQWLVDLEKLKMGAVLADDMGLGKTLQTLAFLEHLSTTHLRNEGRYLVVVPTSLAYNWISESEKFTPGMRTRFLHPTKFNGHIDPGLYVTTYGLMAEHAVYFQSHAWNVVIFDEAQNLKSFTTTRYRSAVEIPGDFKIALTGTPLENHLGELYAIVDLVLPGALGDYATFKKHFLTGTLVATEEVQRLRMVIKPILLRRTKDKILRELPPKMESIHLIPFETQQRKIYRDIAVSWNERILSASKQKSDESLQLQMLTALMRLRQACSDPAGIPGVSYKKVPPKIEHLIEQIQEVVQEGHSVLIFTQFLQTLARVENLLRQAAIQTFVLTGAVSVEKRKLALAQFDACAFGSVLLMTLKTGGVGLNLTKASYVFHVEPWWNPAVENQATDRAHRLGQTRSVHVYRYIMKDSLEEKIQELKAVKKSRFDMVFSEDVESLRATEAQATHLTRQDFEYLLK